MRPPKIRNQVWRPKFRQSANPSSPRVPTSIDTILQRLAWTSQIILVFAGVLGYFFTVRPVHQKQLLDEQIAERTIALQSATVMLADLKTEAEKLRTDNAKLGKEATETYDQLRNNLALKLTDLPYRCAVKDDNTPRSANDVPGCVMKYVRDQIANGLRPEDRSILFKIIEDHTDQMTASNQNVTRKFAERRRKIASELKSVESAINSSDSEIRAEILRLRVARAGGRAVEPDSPTGRIIIRTEEDQKAYDDFVARRNKLADRAIELSNSKIFFDVDLASAYRDALEKVSTKILDEFRKKFRKD